MRLAPSTNCCLIPSGRACEQDPLVRHARPVVDPVVDREPVTDVLEDRPPRRARDKPEARDDQPLEEHLHEEDLLLERVRLEEHVAKLVEMRVAFALPADLPDELEPRLGVARLVLHHRRVVEARLGIGSGIQELRRHLAGDDVRLQLLHDDRAPDVAPPCQPFRRALALGHRRERVPGHVAHLPFLVLRELVEAEDARVRGPVLPLLHDRLCAHERDHNGTIGP